MNEDSRSSDGKPSRGFHLALALALWGPGPLLFAGGHEHATGWIARHLAVFPGLLLATPFADELVPAWWQAALATTLAAATLFGLPRLSPRLRATALVLALLSGFLTFARVMAVLAV